ncbi:unnamed protein product [Ciceribacter selenitireducens ATCC BAA-1503]|uniref:Uncharacterized protein n=1 Tax=Ciceribacter selenitireducens ATCC BAA-1503 TaxID=1336235 RepID=A0A376ABH8_9HYPH|nr:unnamed protein product [Ciceribacter selenitireducens ATCC BAA-1503]
MRAATIAATAAKARNRVCAPQECKASGFFLDLLPPCA